MDVKLKLCDRCGEQKVIWKNHQGKKYCKFCWSSHFVKSSKKPTVRNFLPTRSSKRIIDDKEYSIRRKIFLTANPMCQAHLIGCQNVASQVHHKKGRIGKLLLNMTWWLAVCDSCHHWIENHPEEAKEKGFSLSRLNNE